MKKILSLVLMLSLTVCMAFTLASCGGDGEDKLTYTVTVKDENGNPIEGVQLFLTETDTNEKGRVTTNASGVAVYESNSSSIEAKIVQATGCEFDKNEVYTFAAGRLDITLEKITEAKETYTVYVKDTSGNAVAGASVHICKAGEEGVCLTPKTTDAEGKATFEVAVGSQWKAKFVDGTEYTSFDGDSKEVTLIKN